MKKLIFNQKGQGTLEVALTFIMIVLLVGGIIKIWLWSNEQIVKRQLNYNATRVGAGTAANEYKLNDPNPTQGPPHPWPVYAPRELKEDEVLLENK